MTPTQAQFEYTCLCAKAMSFTFENVIYVIECKDVTHFAYQKHFGAKILPSS